jgi:hypothetical protein
MPFRSAILWMLLSSGAAHAQTATSICDLFKNLRSHRGEIVTVRGEFSTRAGAIIDSACRNRFESPARAWPVAIHLVYVGDNPSGDLVPNFEPDLLSLENFRATIKNTRGHQNVQMVGTFVGLLRTNKDLSPMAGYGHLNIFPAELVLKAVVDLHVIDKAPPSDAGKK